MAEAFEAAASRDAASFASFLAGLVSPEQERNEAECGDRWNCDGLAEDVATIRCAGLPASEIGALAEQPGSLSRVSKSRPETPISVWEAKPATEVSNKDASDKAERKSASVTIRMTREECAQLQERAAAAGLTVSAYLRSCTFEAEALRAQVKQALAQFSAAAAAAPDSQGPSNATGMAKDSREMSRSEARRGIRPRWWAKIFARWVGLREAVSA
jgi:hypothetical protein